MFTHQQFEDMIKNGQSFGGQTQYGVNPPVEMDLETFKDSVVNKFIPQCKEKGLEVWIQEEKAIRNGNNEGYHYYLSVEDGRQFLVYYNYVDKCAEVVRLV